MKFELIKERPLKFELIAGDFPAGTTYISSKNGRPELKFGKSKSDFVQVPLFDQVERVELVTEENKKKILGSVGWGVAGLVIGGLIAAPVAIAAGIAGILKGGNMKEVTFACYLKDGRKFMAVADSRIFTELSAVAF